MRQSQKPGTLRRRPAAIGFGARIRLWVASAIILILVLAGIASVELLGFARASVLSNQSLEVRHAANRIEGDLEAIRKDARAFAGTPPIAHLLREEAIGEPPEVWRDRLERIFASTIETNALISQLRLLDRRGKEVVRVQLERSGRVRAVEPDELQDKSGRDYFLQSVTRGDREVWVSEMNLSREGGAIEKPYNPVVRVMVPVRSGSDFEGLVVANISGRELFEQALTDLRGETIVTDEAGWFLRHPVQRKEFGRDLGTRHRVDDEFNAKVVHALDGREAAYWSRGEDKVYIDQPIAFAGKESPQSWSLLVIREGAAVFGLLREIRFGILAGLFALGVVLLLMVNWVVKMLAVGPILELADSARLIARSDDLSVRVELPERRDELREVYASINEFAATKHALEQTVADRTEALAALVRSVPDALVTIDSAGLIQSLNPAAEFLFGWSEEDVMGQEVNLLLQNRAGSSDLQQAVTRATIGEEGAVEGLLRSGGALPVEVRSSKFTAGGDVFYTLLIRDMSAQQRAQAEAVQREKTLEISARVSRKESMVAGVFLERRERREALTEIARLLSQRLGWQPVTFYLWHSEQQALVREVDGGLRPAGPESISLGEGFIGTTAAGEDMIILGSSEGEAFSFETGAGKAELKELACVPLRKNEQLFGVLVVGLLDAFGDEGRAVLNAVGASVAAGLNELAQYEQLRELSIELEQRGQEILSKNIDLERASRLKTEFLATMSHELRTPLNAIIGFSEAIADELVGPASTEQKDYAHEILQAGEHLLELINDILDLSKIEAGKATLQLEDVPLRPLLENALVIVGGRATEKQIQLSLQIEPGIRSIVADPRKLRQIVYNYLSNAVKFTPPHGKVSVDVRSTDTAVEIRVEDTGIGLEPGDLERVFEPFEQVDSKLSRSYEGSGLGLAMVKTLTELHGGQVGVTSTPGEGSVFWARFPKGGGVLLPSIPSAVEAEPSEQVSVLVIDDSSADRQLLELYLQSAGFSVRGVGSIAEAEVALAQEKPDLITLDLHLPEVDGFTFLSNRLGTPALEGIPVLVISGADAPERAIALGAHALLAKPVRKKRLVMEVSRLLLNVSPSTILVVDDDESARTLVRVHLSEEGHDLSFAAGGKDALAIMDHTPPDLVILDLMMPEMTGFEVIDSMSARAHLSEIPVVVLTAKDLTQEEQAYLAEHANRVFQKPRVGKNELVATANSLTRQRKKKA